MPTFSVESTSKLRECHPDLQRVFLEAVQYLDCKVLEGHRSSARQLLLHSQGASKALPGQSPHNYTPSMAIDVAPYPIPGKWGEGNRNEYEKFRYFGFFIIGLAKGMGIDIRWGGDWDMDGDVLDQDFNDLVHFELVEWKEKI